MAASNHVENTTTGNDIPAIATCFKHKISVLPYNLHRVAVWISTFIHALFDS